MSDASKIGNHERRAQQRWEDDEGQWRAQRRAWFAAEREIGLQFYKKEKKMSKRLFLIE